ncbi:hypothetical protein ASA1KI_45040 [Opitutales bacterium ASA1]|nr:hypothetical protein ASA1KI_45040 [Opitutales bacterium ASA1]
MEGGGETGRDSDAGTNGGVCVGGGVGDAVSRDAGSGRGSERPTSDGGSDARGVGRPSADASSGRSAWVSVAVAFERGARLARGVEAEVEVRRVRFFAGLSPEAEASDVFSELSSDMKQLVGNG